MRSTTGEVIGLSDRLSDSCTEFLPPDDSEVRRYLETARAQLTSSDADTIRVIEDLVDVLIEKKIILLTDLPPAAQEKLAARRSMRNELNILGDLMVGEEDIL